MSDRIHEITKIVDELLRRAQNWAQDDLAPPPIPDDIAMCIEESEMVCHSGDIPQSCRVLVIAVSRLAEEQRKYDNNEHGSRQQNQAPASSWWGSVKAVAIARQGAEKPLVIRRESVKELLRQNVPRNQIAGAIYGHRNAGPLMQANGTPDDSLIDKEAESPGSVLIGWPDWIAPWENQNQDKSEAKLAAQLKVIEKREEGRKYRDPASIEEMLKDGCYVQQIMRGKDVSRSEVLATAEILGITPKEQPGSISEAVDMLLTDDEPNDKPHSLEALEQRAELSDKVIQIWKESGHQMGSPEIRAELAKSGIDMNIRQIAAAIGHYKRKQTIEATTA